MEFQVTREITGNSSFKRLSDSNINVNRRRQRAIVCNDWRLNVTRVTRKVHPRERDGESPPQWSGIITSALHAIFHEASTSVAAR